MRKISVDGDRSVWTTHCLGVFFVRIEKRRNVERYIPWLKHDFPSLDDFFGLYAVAYEMIKLKMN